jgi:hypothetical protein
MSVLFTLSIVQDYPDIASRTLDIYIILSKFNSLPSEPIREVGQVSGTLCIKEPDTTDKVQNNHHVRNCMFLASLEKLRKEFQNSSPPPKYKFCCFRLSTIYLLTTTCPITRTRT